VKKERSYNFQRERDRRDKWQQTVSTKWARWRVWSNIFF